MNYNTRLCKPHTIYVGTYSYVAEPSKVHNGSIYIRRVLDRIECDNYMQAAAMAHDICMANGKGYACSIVPKGMQANSLAAVYVW